MRVCTVIVHARPLVLGIAHALRTPHKLLQLRAHSTDVAATVAFRTSRSRCPSRGRKQVSEIEKKGRTGADGTAKEIAKVLPGDCSVSGLTPNAFYRIVCFLRTSCWTRMFALLASIGLESQNHNDLRASNATAQGCCGARAPCLGCCTWFENVTRTRGQPESNEKCE